VRADELATRNELEQQRLEIAAESVEAQLQAKRATVEQFRALHQLRMSQKEALTVRAGIDGVLQELAVEVGQEVTPGGNLARVAQPDKLKAQLRIAETQAKDIEVGQKAVIDTRNGLIDGKVMRIDPAVREGTVTVDVELVGALPKGARPDLSVDGTIELERLNDVLYVGRPAYGQAESTIGLFKLLDDGETAVRAQVRLGRSSVNTIEVIEGLVEGDQVILSDTSAWDAYDRIRLN
jgi:HlyD family secretion protein